MVFELHRILKSPGSGSGSRVYIEDMGKSCKKAEIQIRLSNVRSHSSFGIRKRLHEPLMQVFNKVKTDFTSALHDILLNIAVKAMNGTLGENRLVPSKLVFGIIPRFSIKSYDLPGPQERVEILANAEIEMISIVAERKLLAALT